MSIRPQILAQFNVCGFVKYCYIPAENVRQGWIKMPLLPPLSCAVFPPPDLSESQIAFECDFHLVEFDEKNQFAVFKA